MAKNLRLKSQKYSFKEEFIFAVEVLVDHGIPNLTQSFTYGVPERFRETEVGFAVNVPFAGKARFGIVSKKFAEYSGEIKSLSKILHPYPIITEEQLELIQSSIGRWGGQPWDFLSFAFPKIPQNLKREIQKVNGINRKIERPEFKLGRSYHELVDLILKRNKLSSQLLVVVPSLLEIDFLRGKLQKRFIEYGSHLTANERSLNYLEVLSGVPNLIIGTRSSIFLPLAVGAEIIVVNDQNFTNYETRYPHWNVRDIALLRSKNFALTFYGHSPSLEISRLIETSWMRMGQGVKEKSEIHFNDGKISWQTVVKKNSQNGPILILVPDRGYVNSLVCQNCRNLYKCECGGRLVIFESSKSPQCFLCERSFKSLSCKYCKSNRILEYNRGSLRISAELGKQFPGLKIVNAKSELNYREIKSKTILVSTYENVPIIEYAAVVAQNFERFGNRGELRATEIARNTLFDLLALKADSYFFDVASNSYFGQIANRANPLQAASVELRDRENAKLPPFVGIVLVEGDSKFKEIAQDQPFIQEANHVNGRTVLKFGISDRGKVIDFLTGVMKYRALKKLKPWHIEMDPLSI